MRIKMIFIFLLFFANSLFSMSGRDIANKLSLLPASKAIKQWERIFTSDRKMKRYGVDRLSSEEKMALKKYLINHAADSDMPELAGGDI